MGGWGLPGRAKSGRWAAVLTQAPCSEPPGRLLPRGVPTQLCLRRQGGDPRPSLPPPTGTWGEALTPLADAPPKLPSFREEPGAGAPPQGPPAPLTQQRGAAVPQRVALVAGDAERRQGVESPLQQRLQAGGGRVRGVEEVVDLLAGRPQLENWGQRGRGGRGMAEP